MNLEIKSRYIWLIIAIIMGSSPHILDYSLSQVSGDLGDTRFNMFILEHGYQYLTGNNSNFWQGNFFYPTEHQVIAFSDCHIGNLPIFSLFRILGFSRETAFQCLIIITSWLNFLAGCYVLRKMKFCIAGSIAGAFIFTYSMPVISQWAHFQLLPRYFGILSWWFMFCWLNRRKTQYFLLACTAILLQFTQSFYITYFTGILILILLILHPILYQKNPFKHIKFDWNKGVYKLIGITCLLILYVGIFIWIITPYIDTSHDFGTRPYETIIRGLPSFQSLFNAAPNSLCWSWLANNQMPAFFEHRLFIGFIPLLLIFVSIWSVLKNWKSSTFSKKDQFASIAIFSLLISFLLISKHENDWSFYYWIYQIPGISAFRALARISLIQLFMVAILIGYACDQLKYLSKSGLYSYIFLVLLIIDQWQIPYQYNKQHEVERINTVSESLARRGIQSGDIMGMLMAKGGNAAFHQIDSMLIAQNLNVKTINGYSGIFPKEFPEKGFTEQSDLNKYLWKHVDSFASNKLYLYNEKTPKVEILTIEDYTPQAWVMGRPYPFKSKKMINYLSSGWSNVEEWGCWSNGNRATINVPIPPNSAPSELILYAKGFVPKEPLNTTLFINNKETINLSLSAEIKSYIIPLPNNINVTSYLKIEFHIHNASSPFLEGVSDDKRLLGIGIESIQLND